MPTSPGSGDVTHAYREDIDRLRGLAVLAVVAFHFEALGARGGYIGVDIFFVISGFLITQIIQRDVRDGRFSFAAFYERRLRRLIPALYVVVLASVIPAFFLLLPSERLDFFRSIAAVVTFTSNILFWSQSGYFDHSAVEKPLLHTWSLAIEEQFYLVFPLLIWLLLRFARHWRHSRLIVAVAVMATLVASFALGLRLMQSGSTPTAFYMSPARAWEFLIGSVIALQGFPALKNKIQRAIALVGGYALLLVPIFGLRQESAFPGWNALVPCLGAALFIWSGTGAPVVERHRFSPYRLARFFGTISYSMYLWHWPLFIYVRFSKDGLTLTGTDKIMLFAATVALSYLSWAFVEQPFRNRKLLGTRRMAFTGAAAASLLLVTASAIGIYAPRPSSDFDRTIARLDAYNNYDEKAVYRGTCFKVDGQPIDEDKCLSLSTTKTNVMLWGDSHAAHYYPGLATLAKRLDVNLLQATQAGCVPTFKPHPQTKLPCRQFSEAMAAWFSTHTPDVVVISGDWMGDVFSSRYDSMMENIHATVAELNARGARVVLIGPAVQFKTGLPAMIVRALSRKADPLPVQDMLRADIFAGDARMKAALPNTAMFKYMSVIDAMCPAQRCPALVGDGVPLTWDYGHLTSEGSNFAIEKLHLDDALKPKAN